MTEITSRLSTALADRYPDETCIHDGVLPRAEWLREAARYKVRQGDEQT